MPELPEVQTVVDDLSKKIKGDTVVSFWSEWPKAIKSASSVNEFSKKIRNRKIIGVRRIGKNIFLDLSGNKTLYIHLKMTGHLLVKPHSNPLLRKERKSKRPSPLEGEGARRADEVKSNFFSDRVNQYIRHKFFLKSGRTLEFSDLRKFGKIVLDDADKINNLKEIKSLGVDALDAKFTFKKFQEILNKNPKAKIGIILMDQNKIAGIGNIYRSEILFEAGIMPERTVKSISEKDLKKVYLATQRILKRAVKLRGTSDSDYRDTAGAPGGFQKVLKVYNREKQKCKICDTIIKRKTLGQRSVFICPKCQK